jgi:hypothetical protein
MARAEAVDGSHAAKNGGGGGGGGGSFLQGRNIDLGSCMPLCML